MKSFFEEFKKFALRGNSIDLAVGVVIGAAFTAITNSLVTNIITPPIGLLIGGIDFSSLGIELGGDAVIQYGLFIEAVMNFLITAFALFLFVKFINRVVHLARKAEKDGTAPQAEKSPELAVLEEIRDSLKKGE
ncbi:MAG TPA: large conductance mechanosensitive channel protein MscL [Candidatus Paceibacterota bacterium]|nr:large conductance mechanosensitive channel protein MscL [Candidatus Paceibacterota bacterium]